MKILEFVFANSNAEDQESGLKALNERFETIRAVRIFLLAAILFLTVLFQTIQPEFINPSVWIPIYSILAVSFLINALLLLIFASGQQGLLADGLAFGYDAVVVTCLIYFTGVNQSIFLFLYLIYIILVGLVYQRKGSIVMALWTSSLFSGLLILGQDLEGRSLYYAIAINNLAFISVALLSGLLSEQIDFMGGELQEKGRELTALKDFNQVIVENVATGFLTVDLEFKISHVNSAAKKILDDSVLVGKNMNEIFPKLKNWLAAKPVFGKDGALRKDEKVENYRKDLLTIELVVSEIKDSDGQVIGYIVMFQDLTEIKRMEFAMRQQDKLAAVGQLAAGIAHEIRNPLASISGSVQLLSGSDYSDQERSQLMSIVIKEIDRLNNLISEFLEFVRPDKMALKPVNVSALLSQVGDMVKTMSNLSQTIVQHTELDPGLMIMGDESKLKQAFLNIVINAYQAMDSNPDGTITLKVEPKGNRVVVSIRDTGVGMDENNLRRLFEPFHTTKTKGTGLGLAITHKIFENHNCQFYVESEEGVGTCFFMDFEQAPNITAT